MIKICPRCGKEYTAYSAISRIDNVTPICPECGVHEALDSIDVLPDDQNKIINIMNETEGDMNTMHKITK